MNEDAPSDTAHYLQPEQLRVGIFVELELPWFKHDFALSAFKICSENQLRKVLDLHLPYYRYDPVRSDVPVTEQQDQKHVKEEIPASDEPVVSDDPISLAEQQRVQFLAQRAQRIIEVEKSFVKANNILKNLNRNLLAKPKETLDEMGALVGEMITAFLESPEVTLHVMNGQAGDESVYYHALNVTILSMMLARNLGFSPEMAHEMGIGALVHDIGLMQIPSQVTMKNTNEYTNAEHNLRAMHVEYGVNIGRQIGLSADALAVVAQHHERSDGSGYPHALKEDMMTPAARIVSLVNYYDNLCNPVDISEAMSPHEALSFMFTRHSKKFETRSLRLLVRKLGVYPPGSIVLLSNEAIASVISVNPNNSLRPCVLVYDSDIPKEKAIVLDLEHEQSVSIVKFIRPSALSPKVLNYINPRKRVTYFFDGNEQPASY